MATNRAVSKLYPLKLSEDVFNAIQCIEGQEDHKTANNLDISETNDCPYHSAAQHARQWLAEWTEIIHVPPRMLEIISYLTLILMHM